MGEKIEKMPIESRKSGRRGWEEGMENVECVDVSLSEMVNSKVFLLCDILVEIEDEYSWVNVWISFKSSGCELGMIWGKL